MPAEVCGSAAAAQGGGPFVWHPSGIAALRSDTQLALPHGGV